MNAATPLTREFDDLFDRFVEFDLPNRARSPGVATTPDDALTTHTWENESTPLTIIP